MSKDRLKELDYIRVIACFSVILVHISAIGVVGYMPGSIHLKLIVLLNRSIKYTTPVFIFLSGITSFYTYRNIKFKYGEFLRKRLPKILVPYIIWSIVYYGYNVIFGYKEFNFSFLFKGILLGTMSYHLYFIVILTQLYFLSPLFVYLFKKYKSNRILVFFGILNFISVVKLDFWYSDRIFLKYMFFYVIGIYVSRNYENFMKFINKKLVKVFAIAGYVITAAAYSYLYYMNSISTIYLWFIYSGVSIVFLYIIGIYLDNKGGKLFKGVRSLSKSSYFIYLIHPFFLNLSILMIDKTNITSLTLKLIIYILIVISSSTLCSIVYVHIKDISRGKSITKTVFMK